MIANKLKHYDIILGSSSPRRKQLLNELRINFSIKKTQKKESYPKRLKGKDIAEFLSKKKADIISKKLRGNYLLITADTIVMQDNKILHKPKNIDEAKEILNKLSGEKHKVITGFCVKSNKKEIISSSETKVYFNKLTQEEITYYINKMEPFDKAGSYGIQEWIGHVGIKKIEGCYNNVVGLPTSELYQKLDLFI
tara:strand:- start:300 stop:884 length:585 start_codon:yes stop_codon:yes gene_type:complete